MSAEAMHWALTHIQRDELPTASRFVLLLLANRADPEGLCWPSMRYIAARTGMSRNTIRAACDRLKTLGLVQIDTRQRDNGSSTSNLYRLCITLWINDRGGSTIDPSPPQPLTQGGSIADPPCTKNLISTTPDGVVRAPAPPTDLSTAPPKNRGTRWPAYQDVPQAWLGWAMGEQTTWTIDYAIRVGQMFKDHWSAVSGQRGVKLDWEATWRNWVRKEGPMRTNGNGAYPKPGPAKPWYIESATAITQKGAELGIEQGADPYPAFRAKVYRAAGVTAEQVRQAEKEWR